MADFEGVVGPLYRDESPIMGTASINSLLRAYPIPRDLPGVEVNHGIGGGVGIKKTGQLWPRT